MSLIGFMILCFFIWMLVGLVRAIFKPDPELDSMVEDVFHYSNWKIEHGVHGYVTHDEEARLQRLYEREMDEES